MHEKGKYLYGIVNTNKKLFFSLQNTATEPATNGIMDNEGVYTIPFKDISAIVSDAEPVDYIHLLRDALAKRLVEHQQVIERVMENFNFAVIPIRLGTFANNEDEVKRILTNAYPMIKNMFNKISGLIEIDVATTWNDFTSSLKEFGEKKEIKAFKESLLKNSKGITPNDQMKLGLMVKNVLDEKKEMYVKDITDSLKPVSQDIKFHQLMDDKMILNAAFLINNVESEHFYQKIDELNIAFGEKLDFRCVGPLPPYSFYTLEIKKMVFKELDWARKRIGLNNTATREDIKKAHRVSALSAHPDKNLDIPDKEKDFDETTRAYKILVDYCRACDQVDRKGNYSFSKEEFEKNALLVEVRS